eukprot:TRINITY_DN19122_c0_g1_i1.p1 TRINITY_DN19122_c0_g1~~TRINITY_DN19122_c0_g1_i1.p1  ORF type:complete len:386 (+),score=77.17 TRINITY_DN19122_c0_g1_i1:79-1236(+)
MGQAQAAPNGTGRRMSESENSGLCVGGCSAGRGKRLPSRPLKTQISNEYTKKTSHVKQAPRKIKDDMKRVSKDGNIMKVVWKDAQNTGKERRAPELESSDTENDFALCMQRRREQSMGISSSDDAIGADKTMTTSRLAVDVEALASADDSSSAAKPPSPMKSALRGNSGDFLTPRRDSASSSDGLESESERCNKPARRSSILVKARSPIERQSSKQVHVRWCQRVSRHDIFDYSEEAPPAQHEQASEEEEGFSLVESCEAWAAHGWRALEYAALSHLTSSRRKVLLALEESEAADSDLRWLFSSAEASSKNDACEKSEEEETIVKNKPAWPSRVESSGRRRSSLRRVAFSKDDSAAAIDEVASTASSSSSLCAEEARDTFSSVDA